MHSETCLSCVFCYFIFNCLVFFLNENFSNIEGAPVPFRKFSLFRCFVNGFTFFDQYFIRILFLLQDNTFTKRLFFLIIWINYTIDRRRSDLFSLERKMKVSTKGWYKSMFIMNIAYFNSVRKNCKVSQLKHFLF